MARGRRSKRSTSAKHTPQGRSKTPRARYREDKALRQLAVEIADWEIKVQQDRRNRIAALEALDVWEESSGLSPVPRQRSYAVPPVLPSAAPKAKPHRAPRDRRELAYPMREERPDRLVRCKERPDSSKAAHEKHRRAKSGAGPAGPRPFIPWCDDRR